jgi:hypothetical protein
VARATSDSAGVIIEKRGIITLRLKTQRQILGLKEKNKQTRKQTERNRERDKRKEKKRRR